MDKERLEKMSKKVTGLTDSDGDFVDAVKMKLNVYAWFYEQAELNIKYRTFKNYDNLETLANLSEEIRRLDKQNKRYRETFERIRKFNRRQLHDKTYTKEEALLEITIEVMEALESESNE